MLYAGTMLVFLAYLVSKLVYNKMIDEEHFMHISHGKLEAALQKKEDLNKNALEAVNVYVEMEVQLTHNLITLAKEVKSGANAARIMAIKGEIERLVGMMDILVMAAPQLKSMGPYIYLMETYRTNENNVLTARLQYNRAVCEYNTLLEEFPYRLVALMYGFKKADIFKIADGTGIAPDVGRQGT